MQIYISCLLISSPKYVPHSPHHSDNTSTWSLRHMSNALRLRAPEPPLPAQPHEATSLVLQLRRTKSTDTLLLPGAQPWLSRLTQYRLGREVDDVTYNDEDEGDGVHPVDVEAEDLSPDGETPEVPC